MKPELRRERGVFSLTQGGPFYALLVRLRVGQAGRSARTWWFSILLWLPLAAGEAVRAVVGAPPDFAMLDLSVHVRLLVTLPLLLLSERLLELATRSALMSFDKGNFCDRASMDPITERAVKLRDAWLVEVALLGVAVLGGQLVLWNVVGSSGLFHGGVPADVWTFPRLWYAIVALPLVQFVMFRWLWRWLIWSYMLARIARLPLALLATHADRACGLTALVRPVTGFGGFVLAVSAIVSGAWGNQVLARATTIQALVPGLVVFLVSAMVVALGPLLLFCGHLFRARRSGLAQYGDFVREYVLRFHDKWIVRTPENEAPLGSPDIQSLNDLGEAFQVVSQTRLFVFGPRNIFIVWFAGILPMIPLLSSLLTVEQVFGRIVRTVLGGFPV